MRSGAVALVHRRERSARVHETARRDRRVDEIAARVAERLALEQVRCGGRTRRDGLRDDVAQAVERAREAGREQVVGAHGGEHRAQLVSRQARVGGDQRIAPVRDDAIDDGAAVLVDGEQRTRRRANGSHPDRIGADRHRIHSKGQGWKRGRRKSKRPSDQAKERRNRRTVDAHDGSPFAVADPANGGKLHQGRQKTKRARRNPRRP